MNERFSYERDALNNVTIRDQVTGRSKFIQGSKATELLAQLDNGAEPDKILSPLMGKSLEEDFNIENASDDYIEEINASAGTYNFPWSYGDQHGFATAMYRTDSAKPKLKLESVRDASGDEIEDVDPDMHQDLMQQARDFIGNE